MDAFATATPALRAWLDHKNLDKEAFDRGDPRVSPGALLLTRSRNAPDGTQTRRWQLRESLSSDAWLTTLTIHAPGGGKGRRCSWFWLDVEYVPPRGGGEPPRGGGDREHGNGRRAAVPHLARLLLDSVDAYDSLARLTGRPALVRPGGVDELIDVVCDPDRRMPVIVASAHPAISFEAWRAMVESATHDCAGLAALFLLDPTATELFDREIGETHGVRGGAVRTYLPGADPASDEDARRHRIMSATRIERDPWGARRLLSGLPRRLGAEARLPRSLTGLTRTLMFGEGCRPEPARRAPAADDEAAALRAEVVRLENDLRAAMDMIDEAERNEERLAERNEELQALSIEFNAVNQRAELLGDQVRSLERRLIRAGRADDAYAPPDEQTVLPASFADLLDRLADLPRVEFTGKVDGPLMLDDMPHSSSWAQTAWQAALAMNAYAEAITRGAFSGGFLSWCKECPAGEHVISPGKVAPDESDRVKNDLKMRGLRLLPVPQTVDPSGRVHMWAHVRLGGGAGMKAPRMHYFDDVKNTGKIYIGYLGPHLKVKGTN